MSAWSEANAEKMAPLTRSEVGLTTESPGRLGRCATGRLTVRNIAVYAVDQRCHRHLEVAVVVNDHEVRDRGPRRCLLVVRGILPGIIPVCADSHLHRQRWLRCGGRRR